MIASDKLTNIPLLEDKLFYMRPVQLTDADDIFEYGRNNEVVQYLPWGPYQSVEEVRSAIQHYFFRRPEQGLPLAYAIVWKENGKMIGTCDYHSTNNEENSGGIGFVLNPDYWNRGIITRAVQLLIDVGYSYFGYSKISMTHDLENSAAARVAEKLCFTEKERITDAGGHARQMIYYEL